MSHALVIPKHRSSFFSFFASLAVVSHLSGLRWKKKWSKFDVSDVVDLSLDISLPRSFIIVFATSCKPHTRKCRNDFTSLSWEACKMHFYNFVMGGIRLHRYYTVAGVCRFE